MHRWKIWLGLSVIFLSGVMIGTLGHRLYVKNKIDRMMCGDTGFIVNLIMSDLCRDLDLTREERQKVVPIIQEATQDLLKLRRDQRCQVDQILEHAVCENKKQLCFPKQQKLDELWTRFKAERARLEKDSDRGP
jgi:hypothetical protein